MTYRSIIDAQSGEAFIAEAMAINGPLLNPSPVPPEILAMYEGLLPALILDVWENYGIGDMAGGRLRLCIPRSLQDAVEQLFEGDPYLDGDTYALAYGAFGDLVAWNKRHQMVYINMQLSSVDVPALIRPHLRRPDDETLLDGLLKLHPGMMDAYDADGVEMFDRAQEEYGPLPPLHIFGMFPPAPFDEPFVIESHRIAEVDEWLAIKFGESIFRLDDPATGRFGLRNIGPLQDGETLVAPGKF